MGAIVPEPWLEITGVLRPDANGDGVGRIAGKLLKVEVVVVVLGGFGLELLLLDADQSRAERSSMVN